MSGSYSTVNPCAMCMPMGSVLVFRGIEGCMPIFHGSQGCSTYMRLYLAHHFREPVDIASSALSEKGAVYGGAANLKKGLRNVIQGYSPRAIGVATTCLAETIGDDIGQIIREFLLEEPLASNLPIIHVSTPSYSGSHEEGYCRALLAAVRAVARSDEPCDRLNLVIGSVISPADVRYLRRLLHDWGCGSDCILLPDISETFDAPLSGEVSRIPEGGTPLSDVERMADSVETLTLGGRFQGPSAGAYLEERFGVPHTALPLPIGLENTDRFVFEMERLTGLGLPRGYELERGRLLDTMVDLHKCLAGVRSAVFGDTEIALGLTKLLCEAGMIPAVVATGDGSPDFVEAVINISPGSRAVCGADFTDIHREIKEAEVEIMIGSSNGRQISQEEKIPLVRVGFPVSDRVGAGRLLTLGYEGAGRLLDTLTNALLNAGSGTRV